MSLLIIIAFIIWGLIVYMLHKNKLAFFKFFIGTVGFFIFSMLFGKAFLTSKITYMILYLLIHIGNITHDFLGYLNSSVVCVINKQEVLSICIGYECSGIIETLVYISILIFFPIYSVINKCKYVVIGILYISFCNVIRILFIIYSVRVFGLRIFFVSHMIIGKILFIGLMIVLFYMVFTRPHIFTDKFQNTESQG